MTDPSRPARRFSVTHPRTCIALRLFDLAEAEYLEAADVHGSYSSLPEYVASFAPLMEATTRYHAAAAAVLEGWALDAEALGDPRTALTAREEAAGGSGLTFVRWARESLAAEEALNAR